jgi:hypothetical protein
LFFFNEYYSYDIKLYLLLPRVVVLGWRGERWGWGGPGTLAVGGDRTYLVSAVLKMFPTQVILNLNCEFPKQLVKHYY